MGILVRDGGVWKDSEPYVKDSGIWKPVDTGYVKDAGVWKEAYSSGLLLEGSWEDGWEGWTPWIDPNSPYAAASRVSTDARTGTWAVFLGGPSESNAAVTYTLPSNPKEVRLSVWKKAAGTATLRYKLGSGQWQIFATDSSNITTHFVELSGVFTNPNNLSVSVQIHQTGGGAFGMRFDDWKIEGGD